MTGVPTVRILKNTYTVQRGNPITLECEVTGSPTHTSVYWTKVVNSQVVTLQMLGAKYGGSSVSSPSLIIFNAEDSDEGPYVCHATNGIGTGQSSQTYLNVEGCKYPLIILKSVIMKYWWLWIHFYLLNTDFDGFHWYHQSTKFVLYAKVNEHLIFCQSTKIDIKKNSNLYLLEKDFEINSIVLMITFINQKIQESGMISFRRKHLANTIILKFLCTHFAWVISL